MKIRNFQAAGLEISAMGFGALHLSLPPRPNPARSAAVIHRAVASGITFVDTADCYCTDESDKHHNEVLVREALKICPEGHRVVVATKGGMRRPQGRWIPCGDPAYLLETIQDSFQALGGQAAIELWQFHAPDPQIDIRRSLLAAAEALKRGWIRRVGLSNVTLAQIMQACEVVDVASVQNKYNLFHRNPEWDGTLDYCKAKQLPFFPWSPLGGKKDHSALKGSAILQQMASRYNSSVYAIALAWLICRRPNVIPIPGTSSPAHLEEWAAACNLELSEAEINAIECGIYRDSNSHCNEDQLLVSTRF